MIPEEELFHTADLVLGADVNEPQLPLLHAEVGDRAARDEGDINGRTWERSINGRVASDGINGCAAGAAWAWHVWTVDASGLGLWGHRRRDEKRAPQRGAVQYVVVCCLDP